MRASAVRSFQYSGSEKDIDFLVTALQDTDLQVRASAARHLREISWEQSVSGWRQSAGLEEKAIVPLEEAVDPLITTLQDTDSQIRYDSAVALGYIGPEEAIGPLITALQDTDLRVRSAAFDALGNASVESIESFHNELINIQTSGDTETRALATLVMQSTHNPSATNALVARLNAPTESLNNRYFAINSLTTQPQHLQNLADSEDLLKTLSELALIDDEPGFIRYGAVLLLASVNTPESLSLLNAHQSDFLALVQAHYNANLPFYLPDPLNQKKSPNPFNDRDESLLASTVIIIPPASIRQEDSPSFHGAEPGDTRRAVASRVAGTPPVCNFQWVANRWRRCQG